MYFQILLGGGRRTQLEYRLYSDPSRPFRYASGILQSYSFLLSFQIGNRSKKRVCDRAWLRCFISVCNAIERGWFMQ